MRLGGYARVEVNLGVCRLHSKVCVRAVSSRVGEAAGDVGLRRSRMSAARKPVPASMHDCSRVVLFAKFADARALE